jgi:hypothetical protein
MMKPWFFVLGLLPLVVQTLAAAPSAGSVADPAADPVANFRLLDHTGQSHELYRQKPHRVVVLFVAGNGCPIVRHSVPELKRLREQFGPRGVVFALLDVNADDDRAEVAAEAREFDIDFPILLDPAQGVARALTITRTAEAIAIDTATWRIIYRGALDDRLAYGQQKPAAERRFLAEALTAFLAGQPVAQPRVEFKGCAVTYAEALAKSSPPVNYAREVAPVIASHCVNCHSRGHVAPFAFSNYNKVRGHSATIREVLLEERMPPWHADPHYSRFSNDRSLTPEQKRILLAWIEQGTPRGEGEDPLPAAQPAPAPDWPLGRPDAIIAMPEAAEIPATGLVPYQIYTVKSTVTEDAWVRGAVIRAGNAKVVHHCLVFINYPDALKHLEPKQEQGTAGFFAGFVPGAEPVFFPLGTAKFLPKGAEFIFQMHYTTTGKEETDRTEMGLYLAAEKPAAELITGAATTQEFEIPPGARAHPVQAEFQFEHDSLLYEFSPHMHLRGGSFTYTAKYPDGHSEVLLNVPNYDFNWQTLYRLKRPQRMPAGTRLVCTGTFDNSADNPANPDPTATVRFGEQTADEMFIGYFNYAAAPAPAKQASR